METDQLKHSELTFQLIVESAPNALVLVNKQGKIAFVNTFTEALFGYKRSELIGQPIELLMPKRFAHSHPAYRNDFFDAPRSRLMGAGRDLFALKKDGTEFPVEIGLNPLVTVEGTMVVAAIIDITERKKAEKKLKEAEERWEFALEGAGDGVWEFDFQTGETYFSKEYKKLERRGRKIVRLQCR